MNYEFRFRGIVTLPVTTVKLYYLDSMSITHCYGIDLFEKSFRRFVV